MPEPTDGKIIEARKRGEWWTVKGVSGGKVVSGDVHASDVEGRGSKHVDDTLRRTIERIAEWAADGGNERGN